MAGLFLSRDSMSVSMLGHFIKLFAFHYAQMASMSYGKVLGLQSTRIYSAEAADHTLWFQKDSLPLTE